MLRIRYTVQSVRDLEQIQDYIAGESPAGARSWLEEYDRIIRLLAGAPGIGAARPQYGAGIRIFPVARHLVIYAASEHEMIIVRILHGARDIPQALEDQDSE